MKNNMLSSLLVKTEILIKSPLLQFGEESVLCGDDNSVFVRVMPYPKAVYEDNTESLNSYYDEVEVCQESCSAYFKAAITIRNNNMIDSSDLVVAYAERKAVVHIKHWNTQEKGNNQYC